MSREAPRVSSQRKHELTALIHEAEALRFRLLAARQEIHGADRLGGRKEEYTALDDAATGVLACMGPLRSFVDGVRGVG